MAFDLMRFNPFKDVSRFEPGKNFDEAFKEFRLASWANFDIESRIKVDVLEMDKDYVVKADTVY